MRLHRICAPLLFALPFCAAQPAAAQRGPDLDAVVRDMLKSKTDVATAARALLEKHRQSEATAVGLLVHNGYRATDVARTSVAVMRMDARSAGRALGGAGVRAGDASVGLERAGIHASAVVEALGGAGFPVRDVTTAAVHGLGMTTSEAVAALKASGYAARDVTRALDEEGMLVDLGCIDPQGFPAPCGNPGGDAADAMGSVTLVPANEGWTDSILTIQGTNIPEVQVLLAGQALKVIEASSWRVRVRLPSQPVTGAVVMRRRSDGVEGTLAATYAVLTPPVEPGPGLDWVDVGTEAVEAAAADVARWVLGAELVKEHCAVNGATIIGSPGVLRSSLELEGEIEMRLVDMGVTPAFAQAFDRTFREAWMEWADHAMIPGLPTFPEFAAWATAEAPPMPGAPIPLSVVVSTGAEKLTPPALTANVLARLGDAGDSPAVRAGAEAFGNMAGARFGVWLATAQLVGYSGWGSVPAVASGSPAGPVVDGKCEGKGVLAHTHF